ncbi:MAG: tetratricopeptide repeat protein [Chromatiales bacterium]|nr:tetratricopeptide repeat protein [Chromatiales bacterium]
MTEESAGPAAGTPDRIQALTRAIAADPARADLHFDLGAALLAAGDPAKAARAWAEAARLKPGWMAPLANRGIALQQLQRHAEAETALRDALRLRPDTEPVLTALAGVLQALGRSGEAAETAGRAAALAPGRPEPWINLGLALHGLGRLADAEAAYRRAIATVPGSPKDAAMAVYNLGHVLNDQWRGAEALTHFRRAVALDPDYQPARHALLFNLLHDPAATEETIHAEHVEWAHHLVPRLPAAPPPPTAPGCNGRPLRVGYVSPDFRSHSCAFFLRPLFAAHDREAVEVFAYASVEQPDAITAWFRANTAHWRDIAGLGDQAIAAQVRADGIDLLVDLAGHTRGQPLGVFALQPAPVQVAWLGYPATSGLTGIGYRLTDAEADPPGAADRLHTERLVRLAGGFHCYQAPPDAPDVGELPAFGRQHGGDVTFGSFNNISKITPGVVASWAGILRALPGAKLVLKGQLLAHDTARSSLAAAFAAEGIDAGRIELRAWVPRAGNPLAAYQDIDIALDTFPYNGTTTTFEALWMGVPVVTLRGGRHAARVGASILTHLGRPEWIAGDPAAYQRIALEMATNLPALAGHRRGLRRALRASSLCDATGFARKLESTYRELLRVRAGGAGGPRSTAPASPPGAG